MKPSAKTYSNVNPKALYTGIYLDQKAMRILAKCERSNIEGKNGMAVGNLDNDFHVIPTSAGTLPLMPGLEGDLTVLGVDTNNNCVRDDIKHLIFELYGLNDRNELRQHLYVYAIWLRFYLVDGISDESIQAVSINRVRVKSHLALSTEHAR